MDALLEKLLLASGVSGYEKEVAAILKHQLQKSCSEVYTDNLGNVIAHKGKGPKKIMLCAHMDEVGLVVKHVTKEGYIHFIKVGGIDDRILLGQRVLVKAKKGDVRGIIGAKPPHLQKEHDKNMPKYEDMFIDIGAKSKEAALKKIEIADSVVFEATAGVLKDSLYFGKAVDDRIGCYALIKTMERLKSNCEVYAVATTQEEVGLKGARTASFTLNPDFALVIDTVSSGDTPQTKEADSSFKLGEGVAITIIEAAGRGIIVNEKIKDRIIDVAKRSSIKHQVGVLEGGMTDAAIIYLARDGIPTGVLSVPARYIHSASCVFDANDLQATIDLAIKLIESISKEGL